MEMETGRTRKEVEEYIERQKSPQKEIVKTPRKIILRTVPHISEEIKLGVPWYEGKFYIVALKDHVNLGFSIEGLLREGKETRRRRENNEAHQDPFSEGDR